MRSPQANWLAALLFPLKIYTLLAGAILYCWHANLPPDKSDIRLAGIDPSKSYIDQAWINAVSDFAYVTHYARLGYFLCALILIVGGLGQLKMVSCKAGVLTVSFGLAALFIGLLLTSYARSSDFVLSVN